MPFGDNSTLFPIEFSQKSLTSNAKLIALIFTERGLNFFWTWSWILKIAFSANFGKYDRVSGSLLKDRVQLQTNSTLKFNTKYKKN